MFCACAFVQLGSSSKARHCSNKSSLKVNSFILRFHRHRRRCIPLDCLILLKASLQLNCWNVGAGPLPWKMCVVLFIFGAASLSAWWGVYVCCQFAHWLCGRANKWLLSIACARSSFPIIIVISMMMLIVASVLCHLFAFFGGKWLMSSIFSIERINGPD